MDNRGKPDFAKVQIYAQIIFLKKGIAKLKGTRKFNKLISKGKNVSLSEMKTYSGTQRKLDFHVY